MNCVRITPSMLKGCIKIPSSKSLAHRAIICASLSNGVSMINNVDMSKDITATIECMRILGAVIEVYGNRVRINGANTLKISKASSRGITLDCNESGSTIRFLIPIALMTGCEVTFTGHGKLPKRPLDVYYDIFKLQNIAYTTSADGFLPMTALGLLKSGVFYVPGNISSQFITGLLFTLPILDGNSEIIINNNLESKGYIDLTLDILAKFGIKIVNNDYKSFSINGNQRYVATDYTVESDYSQACFWLAANMIGSDVRCEGLSPTSLQGDKEILNIIEILKIAWVNAEIITSETETHTSEAVTSEPETRTSEAEPHTSESVISEPIRIDASQIPDMVPVLAVIASLGKGTVHIVNASRLRIKECNRLAAIVVELSKIGADIEENGDGLIINGKPMLDGGETDSWNDHRICMAIAIAATRCKNAVTITNSGCVDKSYADFWLDYKELGGNIHEWSLGQ